MKHPYAEILHAIAEGKEIQWQRSDETWQHQNFDLTLNEISEAEYAPERYRIKPATITINGVEVEANVPASPAHYRIEVCAGAIGEKMVTNIWFRTAAARDAAYSALIKPFSAAIGEGL